MNPHALLSFDTRRIVDALLRAVSLAAFAVIVCFPNGLCAGEIWDGGWIDSNWTSGRNWNGPMGFEFPPPNNGTANIHMAGNNNTFPNVDIPYSINSLTFDAGSLSFFITGQELTIGAGGVTNNDNSAQVITAPVKLAASQTWTAAGSLLQANAINLNGVDLTMGGAFNTTLNGAISGSGDLILPGTYTATTTISGTSSNTYAGTTRVYGGTLVLSKTGGDVAIPGKLRIGPTPTIPAVTTVRLNANEQISHAPGNEVEVTSYGLLDLNGHTETIARLNLHGTHVSVTTGSGKLIVGEYIHGFGGVGDEPTITGNVDLNGGQPIIGTTDGLGGLVIDGILSNGGATFGNSVYLRGAANTYTGPTVIIGSVYLNKSGVDGAFRGDVTIAGFLGLDANEQILAAPGNEVFVDNGNLDMNTFSETIQDLKLQAGGEIRGTGTLTVLGTVTSFDGVIRTPLNLAGTRVFDVPGSLAVTGTVSNGNIVKNGPGTLYLYYVSNTYSGGTFINAGTVIASEAGLGDLAGAIHFNGGVLGANGTTFATTARTMTWGPNGGGFDISNTGVFTISTQSLSGPGPLTKLGAGKLVLLAPQSYTGGTTVSGGTLEGNTQTLQGNIVNNATLAFNQTSNGTYAGNLSGSGTLSKAGAGVLRLVGANTYSGTTAINAGTLELAGGSAIGDLSAVTLANAAGVLLDLADSSETIGSLAGGGANGGSVVLGTGTLTTGGNDTGTTFAGIISGTGSIVKTGSGVFTPSGANTYTGGTTFARGVLSAGSDANLGDPAGPLHFDGGTLRVTGAFNTTQRTVELLAGGGGLDIANATNNFTYAGNITGPGGLTKVGTGTLVLAGNNSYSGTTTINAGTLRTAGGVAIPNGSAITLADAAGAVFDLNSANETIGSLSGGGSAGGNITLGTAILTTGGDHSSTTFAGAISGSGGLVKTGTGVFTLGGNNTHTGLTDIQQGTLRLGSVTGVPTGNAVNVAAAATFDLNGLDKTLSSLTGAGEVVLGAVELALGAGDATSSFGGSITGSGRLVKIGAGTLTLDGANSYTGGTTVLAGRLRGTIGGLQGNILDQAIVEFAQTSDGTYSDTLSGPGSLIKTGPGRVTIAAPATYTGATTISAGTLIIPNTLNTPGGAIQIDTAGTLEASGILQRAITGTGQLTATGNLVAGDIANNSGFQAGAVNVGSHAVTLHDADLAHIGGGTIAGGSLTTLAGLELIGGNFSGHGTINSTFINRGTVAGPVAPQALSFVGPLSGTGSFTGNIRILDSLSPGNSPAAVSFENVSLGDDAVLTMELAGLVAGIDYDTLSISGAARLDGRLDVVRDPAWNGGPQSGDQFRLLQGGTIEGTFDEMSLPALSGDLSWQVIQTPQQLTLIVVPEPSTALLMIAGGLCLRRGTVCRRQRS